VVLRANHGKNVVFMDGHVGPLMADRQEAK
jgi:prepilin-type processing-associated H-X9-DG protein